MRCCIDTNILISAGLFPGSVPALALSKAMSPPNTAIVCDYSIDEAHRVIHQKFPSKANDLDMFIRRILFTVEPVSTPVSLHDSENAIRDITDRPILRAAIKAGADILLTGDKDFTESSVVNPKIMTAAQFISHRE